MSRLHASEIRALPEHLAQIPQLYGQLPMIDEPDRSDAGEPNDQGKTDRKPGSAAPLNLTVVHLTDTRQKNGWRHHNPGHVPTIQRLGTLPSLFWWTQFVLPPLLEQANVPVPPQVDPATVESECAWLAEVQQFVLAQAWAPMFVRDIAQIHAKLEQTSTGKVEFVPRCDACALEGRNVRLDPQDDASWYKCPHCTKEFTPSRSGDLARRQPPLPAEEIAAALGISAATIRTWKFRGFIAPAAHQQGRPLYHLADVQRVNERVRERGTHRKGKK